MKTYCMSLYGCPLWELDGKNIEKFYVAWRKGIRRLFGLPNNTHCALLNLIFNDITIDSQIDKRVYKFLASCKMSDNSLTKLCYNLACYGSQSTVSNNISFLCSKYGLCRYTLPNYLPSCSYNNDNNAPSVSNCIKAEVVRDMLNVIELSRHDSRLTGLNCNEARELLSDICSN